ncbi:hypothetical protein [Xylanimonas allomyrinae]|uniref:hypothetical protein n=1 Tax=Xylanimonas allomyrinae TaxID=2509459 RepID=UPI00319D9E3F
MRVVVDTVEDLARRLLAELRERLVQRGREQVAAQPPLGAVDDARPGHQPGAVEQRATHHARGQHQQRRRGRGLGHPAGDDGADRLPDGTHDEAHEGERRCGSLEAPPVEPAAGVSRGVRTGGAGVRRSACGQAGAGVRGRGGHRADPKPG